MLPAPTPNVAAGRVHTVVHGPLPEITGGWVVLVGVPAAMVVPLTTQLQRAKFSS